MEPSDRPIGYWLKHLDRLIESTFDRSLAEHELSRRHWQAMNALSAASLDAQGLREALRPFLSEDAITVEEVIGAMIGRGWIAQADDRSYALTEQGQAAHAAVAGRVKQVRHLMLHGLTEQEYIATVRTLSQMAANLESVLER